MSEWKNGLPPVGTHCECTWGWKGLWLECIYHGKLRNGMPIIEEMGGGLMEFESALDNIEFRPLKSEAERKRDEEIEKFQQQVFRGNGFALGETKETLIVMKAIEAGYRKVNDLTDEQIDRVKYSNRYDFGECSYETAAYREGMRDARRIIMGEES